MINKETVKFIALLNELARETKNGIYPLSTATEEQKNGFIYDDKKPSDAGNATNSYPPAGGCHDFVPYLDAVNDYGEEISIEVYVNTFVPDKPTLNVYSKDGDICFCVEDGHWYPVFNHLYCFES